MDNLRKIRDELLGLHKVLLEIERSSYEAQHGSISPVQLLQLLFEDQRFAWLRNISMMVTEYDELFADKVNYNEESAKGLLEKTKKMFDDSDNFSEFKSKYRANLDTESSVGIINQKLLSFLGK